MEISQVRLFLAVAKELDFTIVTARGRGHSSAVGASVQEATQKKWFGERVKRCLPRAGLSGGIVACLLDIRLRFGPSVLFDG